MTYFNMNALLIGLVAFCSLVPGTVSNPYTISDARVQNLDVTPSLGRGYSIMTNSFTSSCLDVRDTTVPSYNYKYEFYDFIDNGKYATIEQVNVTTNVTTTIQVETQEKQIKHYLRVYYSYQWVLRTYRRYKYTYSYYQYIAQTRITRTPYTVTKTSSATTSNNELTVDRSIPVGFIKSKDLHMIVSVMRIERYYSSVKDESSDISEDAKFILDADDYVGFFKACGPNYVRGIRRAQEVTAVFTFKSDTIEKAKNYKKILNQGLDATFNEGDHKTEDTSLTISMQGYGIGAGMNGSGTLVATTLEEYREAMKYAFRAMTQTIESAAIGQVHAIEVVPWVDNVVFQGFARLQDVVVDVPLPRSLIPPAISVDEDISVFVNNATTRLSFRCKDPAFQIDKYGNCCEENDLYNYITMQYANDDPMTKICRPVRTLEKVFLKNNMIANGEFVSRLDSAMRFKLNDLSVMQQCISAARAFPDSQNYNILKPTNVMKESDMVNDNLGFSVLELKLVLDPFNDHGLVAHLARELDEFVSMYYSPCLAALFGTNVGTNPNTDPSFFMAYPWHSHDECLYMSCLTRGMRWDRELGGCIPGLMGGTSARTYPLNDNENEKCQKDDDTSGDTEECKHKVLDLATYHTRATNCWQSVIPSGQVTFFLDNHCMPQISPDQITPTQQLALAIKQADACEQAWHPRARSKKLNFVLKRTKFFVAIRGACVTDGKAIMTQKSGSGTYSPEFRFEYNYHRMTITLEFEDCDKVLTLDDCSDSGRLTMQDYNANLKNKWKIRDGGLIESVDCAGYYIATKETGQYESGKFNSELGVTTDRTNWEAVFEIYYPEEAGFHQE